MKQKTFFSIVCGAVCTIALFTTAQAQTNVALGKPTVVSSWDSVGFGANGKGLAGSLAVDGDPGTRWATDWNNDVNRDSGWIYVDLQAAHTISSVVITWETAGAVHYVIQVANFTDPLSPDTIALLATDAPWTTVAEVNDGISGETRTITFAPTPARQVRIRAYSRTTNFGYSIWELQCIDPSLSVRKYTVGSVDENKIAVTPTEIKFFAPGITGCALYDLAGHCIKTASQPAASELTISSSSMRGAYIARLTTKNGVTSHRLTMLR